MTTHQVDALYHTGFHIQGRGLESVGDLLASLLKSLSDVENRFDNERDELVRWVIPEILRCQLLRDLKMRHGLECKPYIERLSALYDHLLTDALCEAEEQGRRTNRAGAERRAS